MKLIYKKSCGGIVTRQGIAGTEVLLIRYLNGHWSFPKGRQEPGESDIETARREIAEETGLEVELDTAFCRRVPDMAKEPRELVFFAARPQSGRLKIQEDELDGLGWFLSAAALPLIRFEVDRQVLEQALVYLSSRSV